MHIQHKPHYLVNPGIGLAYIEWMHSLCNSCTWKNKNVKTVKILVWYPDSRNISGYSRGDITLESSKDKCRCVYAPDTKKSAFHGTGLLFHFFLHRFIEILGLGGLETYHSGLSPCGLRHL